MEDNKLGPAILLAAAAAIVGGIVWALIGIIANYELGLIAWGIGFVAGYAVTLPSKTTITRTHQFVAVIASIVGILLGKYLYFANVIDLGFLNPDTFKYFMKNLNVVFGLFDILFVVLAIASAWQIPISVAYQAAVAEAEAEALAEAQAEMFEQREQDEISGNVVDEEKEVN